MERLIDPALADLQLEYDDAVRNGRYWQSRWIWLLGHVAFFRMLTVHAGVRASGILHGRVDEDRRSLMRAFAIGVAIVTLGTVVLIAVPLRFVISSSESNFGELVIYLIPQALPVAIPIGLTFGMLLGLGTIVTSWRSRVLAVFVALLLSGASFALVAWIVPATNQMFRVAAVGGPVLKGPNELTLGELDQLLRQMRYEPTPGSLPYGNSSLALSYHMRWALACAPLAHAIFALALISGRRRKTFVLGAYGCAAIFGYYVAISAVKSLVHDTLPAFVIAWIPNTALLLLSTGAALAGSTPKPSTNRV